MDIGKPQHKVCEKNVEVPTIVLPQEREGVWLQWFGDATGAELAEMQFLFPIPLDENAMEWMGHPELFKVIMVGQIKDWPMKEAVRKIAEATKKDVESWVLWVVSSHYQIRGDPACFIVPLPAMLGDGECGVITPHRYCDTDVLERESEKYS